MKAALFALILLFNGLFLKGQMPSCTPFPSPRSEALPRNACLQVNLINCHDSSFISRNSEHFGRLIGPADSIPLQILAAYQFQGETQLLLQPINWLNPETTYHLQLPGKPSLSETYTSHAEFADGLVAIRTQPALAKRPQNPMALREICLELQEDAWHWLEIKVLNRWTGEQRSWIQGGMGQTRCLSVGSLTEIGGMKVAPGDEYAIFVTPVSIDGAKGRRSEPIRLQIPLENGGR